jgi:hypothetical protein
MIQLVLTTLLAASLGPVGSEPAREPQLAARGSEVVLAFGAGNSIYFSSSHDSGRTFSVPVKVAQAGVLPLSRHRGPRIVFSGAAILISVVAGRTPGTGEHAHGLPSDGDLLVWRSLDDGKSWSAGTLINDVPGAPNEGLHSLASDGKSGVLAVWLDKRSGKGTQLYGARSTDGGLTWSKNFAIYQSPEGSICECCHPSVALDSNGQPLVMWRNWLAGSRDLYLARSRDGVSFEHPEKLGTGTWKLNACPMDGGGVAVSAGRVFTAWRREQTIFLDEAGKPETAIGPGKDVALSVNGHDIYVIWSAPTGIVLWKNGQTELLANAGAFPSIVALSGAAVAAWEQDGTITTQRLEK